MTFLLLFVSFSAIFRKFESFLKTVVIGFNRKKRQIHHWRSVYLHYIIFPVSFFPRPWWMQQKIEPSLSNCLIWNMDGGGALQIMTILADVTWLELTMNTLSHLFKVKFLVVLLWRFIVNFEHMSRAYLGLFLQKQLATTSIIDVWQGFNYQR